MKRARLSLRKRLRKAILLPAAFALVVTVVSVFLFGWLNHRGKFSQIESELDQKTVTAVRRISAELLIGSRGAPYAVADSLKSDLKIDQIQLSRSGAPCIPQAAGETCHFKSERFMFVVGMAGIPSDSMYVILSSPVPTLRESIPINVMIWAVLPILLSIGAGIWLQQRQLRRFYLLPIESIIDKTVSGADIPSHWPREFVHLQNELDDAFQKRDQALIGQIASGIIHDLKTLLQPISGATQLASEFSKQTNSDKSVEMLLKACQRNLPKMQRILEDVLDGNREVKLQVRKESIARTVEAAVENAKEAADSDVPVLVEFSSVQDVCISHDPIQLERALTNLIKNGIEAAALSNSQNIVRISIERIRESEMMIAVEDSGSGLSAPMEQLIASRKTTKRRGTGLGLLVTKKIIEAHRGAITGGKSETLSGARFSVLLKGVQV